MYFASTRSGKIRNIIPESNFKFFYDDNFDVKVAFEDSDTPTNFFILYRPGREWRAERLTDAASLSFFEKEKEKLLKQLQ